MTKPYEDGVPYIVIKPPWKYIKGRQQTNKRVLANGCFDVLHYGHYRHLAAARDMGDALFVAVTKDAFVNKGADRPYYDDEKRADMVAALKDVDSVMLVSDVTEAFYHYKPQIWALGTEYKNNVRPEHKAVCLSLGIEIRFTDEERDSSTNVINELRRR